MKRLYKNLILRLSHTDKSKKNRNKFGMVVLLFCMCTISCRKFVEIDPPKTSLVKATVFTDDQTATAAVIDIYSQMTSAASYSGGGISGLSYLASLASDELDLYATAQDKIEFANNNLTPVTAGLNTVFWAAPYQHIFRANAILEGLIISSGITPSVKSRLEGEAKFFRAFSYFYLVNLFGDVPLVLTTDYRINAVIPRTSKANIYQQIVKDLQDAQNLLVENYQTANGANTAERKRINKFAATAMLARVFLYMGEWTSAEIEAGRVISYASLYGPEPIANMFLKNSKEAIWQLGKDIGNTNDASAFIFSSIPNNGALRASFYSSFENTDLRKSNWIVVKTSGGNTYYQPAKYKALTSATAITEYSTVLRLGEQYLIRAEARAHLGKITGQNSAESDLNFIRNRAGLGNTTSTNETTMLNAIEQERRLELFTEMGHRWLDLKRTNRADAVLGPLKGTNWQTIDQLWPIPQQQIQNDPAMANQQNPGYN